MYMYMYLYDQVEILFTIEFYLLDDHQHTYLPNN